ncbi:MAG: aspartyl protease family protein, partial [Saprospiraceae bacterium]
MKSKALLFFILLFIVSSCNSYRTGKIITSGSVIQTAFHKKINYEKLQNWIIITAKVNNSDKEYRFLFDTGAVSVVSSEMAKELGLKNKAENDVGSSNSHRKKTVFTTMEKINIEGIDFEDIGAVIIDFDTSPEIKCLGAEIDGIIGANLMKLAVWQIDYIAETLEFADNQTKLEIDANNVYKIPFTHNRQGSPKVTFPILGKKVKVTFDTGKTGGIGVNRKQFGKFNFENDSIQMVKGIGQTGAGVFGVVTDTSFLVATNQIKIYDLPLDTVIFSTAKKSGSLLGNTFLEDYKVTFNWESKIISLEPQVESKLDLEGFGMGYTLKEDKLIVSFMYENSPAQKANIKLGTQVISVNEHNFEDLTIDSFCAMRKEKLLPDDIEVIQLKYKLPDSDEVKSIELRK